MALEILEFLDRRYIYTQLYIYTIKFTSKLVVIDSYYSIMKGPGGEPGDDGEPGERGPKGKAGAAGDDGHPGKDVSNQLLFLL